MWLTDRHRLAFGTSWVVVLGGLPLVRAQAEVRQGLRDGVDVDVRGEKNQIIVHSRVDEI
jgi:predicted aconitase with swiveling domain